MTGGDLFAVKKKQWDSSLRMSLRMWVTVPGRGIAMKKSLRLLGDSQNFFALTAFIFQYKNPTTQLVNPWALRKPSAACKHDPIAMFFGEIPGWTGFQKRGNRDIEKNRWMFSRKSPRKFPRKTFHRRKIIQSDPNGPAEQRLVNHLRRERLGWRSYGACGAWVLFRSNLKRWNRKDTLRAARW